MAASAHLPRVRARRLLRRLAQPARQPSRRVERTPDHPLPRAGRGLVLVLSGRARHAHPRSARRDSHSPVADAHPLMPPVSRGFHGRRRSEAEPRRLPPGQYLTPDFPVLSAGPTPHTPLEHWTLAIEGAIDEPRSWTWEEF